MKKLFITFLLLFSSYFSFAQLYEAGVFLGGSNYIGDIGRTNYIYPNSGAYGGVFKFNYNPHFSFRATYTYSSITANDLDSDSSFRQQRGLSFSTPLHEVAAGLEYHFFKYNLAKQGQKSTPYIIAQVAVNYYNGLDSSASYNFTLPFGFGFKTQLSSFVGLAFETSFRYTFKDDLDGYPTTFSSPTIEINPNDSDWYVFTGITLVYTFGREGCYVRQY